MNTHSKTKQKTYHQEQHIKFYNSSSWAKLRLITLNEHPLCYICKINNLLVSADTVDHCLVFKDVNDPLASDSHNLYSLCGQCHANLTWYETKNKHKWLTMYQSGATIGDIAKLKYNGYNKLNYVVDADGYYV